ncbi:MAG TPA: hypothetical protein VEO93_07265 [Gemmatimonadales bacterium]|nr:hypothetical protein [Gemmatimonadales bacterium]
MTRLLLCGIALACLAPAARAQRPVRIGVTASSISIEDGSGQAHGFPSFGGSLAVITGDDAEMGVTVARYNNLSSDACTRALTFYGVDSYYYPIGPKGVAPFASAEIGLARVTESNPHFGCGVLPTIATTNELGFAYGLGVRVNLGPEIVGLVEGRFFQVPNSAIQALEARANVSVAFGRPRASQLLAGTVGPEASYLIHLSGPLAARAPFLGVRFRRDTKKAGAIGLQIDYAPFKITGPCSSQCQPTAILFAPGYEASAHPSWGRFYGVLGGLLAGFYTQGPDRGVAQGAHGVLGADINSGKLLWNVNARVLWLQRSSGENVFGVQAGVSVMPKP